MPRLLGVCLLWLGLLLLCQQSGSSRARRLCGRHLLKGIIKLCGDADWSHIGGKAPFTQLPFRATGKVESFVPDRLESSQTTFPAWGRGTRSVFTSASQEEAKNTLEVQSLPAYRYKKDNLLSNRTREFSLSQDVNSYIRGIVGYQKKNTNKIKTLSKLFWGNHPQRIRRGYSEKCCLKGCTKEELLIACLPYIDYKNLKKGESVVTEIY
ncbi:insulin-like peptide INSL6 [Rousettus aegyptiacus]|uniref:Insulin like 6 n=1 Tax=Rousettus aegyptiacus TaxID=9407 RepID=A0A7J8IKW5_ROUAE|nr:insulin-like peptide INSL6 [Rousettus aegyptiacus]KAF6484961.1 insulin like 6 [Rousettus aegyptiacus]